MNGTVKTAPYAELNRIEKVTKNVGADSISARQYGITLIALVITIIVLLILAGITISIVLSEDGIVAKANEAKEKQEVAEMIDRLTLAEASTASNYLGVNLEKYKDQLKTEKIVKQDESNYIASAEGLSYELTSDKGYVFTVTEPTKGDIVITYEGKAGELPPKIIEIKAIEKTASSIKTQVNVTRLENGTLSYYYTKQSDANYITLKENTTEKEVNFTGLTQNQIYTIKVVAQNSFGKSNEVIVNVVAGQLQAGTISQKGTTIWTNGQAGIELQTTMPSFEMQYQINGIDGKWIKYTGAVTGLKHNDVVYARLWDGMNGSATSSIQVIDEILPQDAIITMDTTIAKAGEKLTAKVQQIDNQSGVDASRSKWILVTINTNIGIEEINYTGEFNTNVQTIELPTDKTGTYYLHILTVDIAGNKKETISEQIKIKTNVVADGSYSEKKGVNTPKLGEGMNPIKWDEIDMKWIEPTDDDDWYDYNTQKWANAQTNDGSYWVWLPRYSYQIETNYHTNWQGIINIEFMKGLSNESSTGRKLFDNSSGQGNWNIHPAFSYGQEVAGIWIAKFEASKFYNSSLKTDVVKVLPNAQSWRGLTISDMYTKSITYNTTLNSHMMKNIEWGAIAYITQSKYGINQKKVGNNGSASCITGIGGTNNKYDTILGQNASTTSNIYGIYDMVGCSNEYIAAYTNNGNGNLIKYGASLANGEEKTKDVYTMLKYDESSSIYQDNKNKYGDAVYETSSGARNCGL